MYVLLLTCLGGRLGINRRSAFLRMFEISGVKRGQFQNFQKSRG